MDGKMAPDSRKYITTTIMILLPLSVSATELVYTPINPSFGGSPLNASMLLNKAQAQNKHKAPIIEQSYAEKFQDSLERTYLNRMVREITDIAFGEDIDESIFNQDSIFLSGDYEIQVITSTVDSITVRITNTTDNSVVVIEVPRFS
ncbi:MAG: curli production assembly/transport component CsgF [Pseudoalteromonas rhizosphaerae]|jgi:curli production assembly/transport component CsgF|uniref:Curli production assembly/transport component CsgF n=2 Tax=Pseudoalteromonas TaxID=53246 RepID=A0ABY3FHC6_9GAMM|nr:curli production assembly protein CsgF [Pseudoalteromonas sp. SR44-8]MBB1308059.1 curli production assembly protein CsgF [Pseudoalteromonas sp. SR41-8]MBB1396127.1 curli production assembly protein CsgF [Pseudoalteromonas sp. SG44-8]MBB1407878.1 curli production assembly protein CsgF [Pseudoalteromonas sp. SG44-17]MBB1504201.1 curli production assembly protein CsgF [Pseudoalteromonas sp. SG41-1]TVU85550.1 curli production assembly protein CsgF [Pseudoalteromonas neustonica]|tara:strand:+ start:7829 stop:8269 length:441 start_codon:yes stop_codon:yes gene_type:complete